MAPNNVLAGIGWMVVSGLMFVCVIGLVRLVGTDVPAPQAAFLRYAFGTLLLLPTLAGLLLRPPAVQATRIYLARGVVHAVAVTLWFFAMARIPIAEVTAINYTAPIYTAIGAAIFFSERLHIRRIAAIAVGMIGALVILRPGFQTVSLGQLAVLGSAPLFAISALFAKRLTGGETSMTIVAMLSLVCTIALLPGAVVWWVAPTLAETALLAATAVFATIGHYAMTRAFSAAPLTVTQPVTFVQLAFASVLGIAVFGDPLDPFVIAGGGIIVAAITFISHRESVAARRDAARAGEPGPPG